MNSIEENQDTLYKIERQSATQEFLICLVAAANHLHSTMQSLKLDNFTWLKCDMAEPFLEHLSFRIGNQLFYVQIVDIDEKLPIPTNSSALKMVSKGSKGHPCLMPMKLEKDNWKPVGESWGLLNAKTGKRLDPISLVTDEDIEMSDWEIHDFGVQIVVDHIKDKLGFEMISAQGNPKVDPSLWFKGGSGPEWVVLRAVRYPETVGTLPNHIDAIRDSCARIGKTGHFASVCVANGDETFEYEDTGTSLSVIRGKRLFARFKGLKALYAN